MQRDRPVVFTVGVETRRSTCVRSVGSRQRCGGGRETGGAIVDPERRATPPGQPGAMEAGTAAQSGAWRGATAGSAVGWGAGGEW